MSSVFGWLGDVANWLLSLVPRLVLVRATERGVKFVRGRTIHLEPGLHVYWPVTTEVESMAVVRQVATIEPQVLVTADEQTVIAGGVVIYSISNYHRFVVENYDAHANVDELAKAAVRKAIVGQPFSEVQSSRQGAAIDGVLTRLAAAALEPFGVEVEAVRLTDFARTQVLSVFGDVVSVGVRS